MGIIALIRKAMSSDAVHVKKGQLESEKLSYVEKERIMVQRMTAKDMLLFPELPYDLHCHLYKYDKPGAHAFAYMNLTGRNIKVAKSHLMTLEKIIESHRHIIPSMPKDIYLNVNAVIFHQYSKNYGYTRLMCTPKTFSGKLSARPLTLWYTSRQPAEPYMVCGQIVYSSAGYIENATANIYLRIRKPMIETGIGWWFTFVHNENSLILQQVKATLNDEIDCPVTTVYKSPSLIELERVRAQEEVDFKWLQENISDKCPKSLTGYRHMKTTNSKNYQAIVAKAKELGYKIT